MSRTYVPKAAKKDESENEHQDRQRHDGQQRHGCLRNAVGSQKKVSAVRCRADFTTLEPPLNGSQRLSVIKCIAIVCDVA
jgi:hypothetical protein